MSTGQGPPAATTPGVTPGQPAPGPPLSNQNLNQIVSLAYFPLFRPLSAYQMLGRSAVTKDVWACEVLGKNCTFLVLSD